MQPPPGAPPRLVARPPPVPPPPLAGQLPPLLLPASPAQAIQQPPLGLPPPVTAAPVAPLNVAPAPAATVPGGPEIRQPVAARPNIAQFIANLGWRNGAPLGLTAPLAVLPRPPPITGPGPAAVAAVVGKPSVLNALQPPLPPPMAAAQVAPLNVAAPISPNGSSPPQHKPAMPNIPQFIANLGWRNQAQVNLTAPLAAPPPTAPQPTMETSTDSCSAPPPMTVPGATCSEIGRSLPRYWS